MTDGSTNNGTMSANVSSAYYTPDFFNDGTGQTVQESNDTNGELSTINNPDGTTSISLTGAQSNLVQAQSPGFLQNDYIPGGPTVSSTFGTDDATNGSGDRGVSWSFASTGTGAAYSSPVTLNGEFKLQYTASASGWYTLGLDFKFGTSATGIGVATTNQNNFTVSYPSGGSTVTQVYGTGESNGFNGATQDFNIDFDYSTVDTTPAAGETVTFTSTVSGQATDMGGGEPSGGDATYANAQNNLSFSFTENAS